MLIAVSCLIVSACQPQLTSLDNIREVATAHEETVLRDTVSKQVQAAVEANDFKQLSALGHDFLTKGTRTPSGIWYLAIFHAELQFRLLDGLDPKDGCEFRKQEFVERWAAAQPASPGPIITHANMLGLQAWCFRGAGAASAVAEDAWPKFYGLLQAADELLEANKDIASVDPEFYAVKSTLYRGLGKSRLEFDALLKEATRREPNYHRTYFNAVMYYLPQWGGSFEEVENFARFAAYKSEKSEGTGMYARVFWALHDGNRVVLKESADWPTLQQSMRDVYVRNPVAWNRERFMGMACAMHQPQESVALAKAGFPFLSRNDIQNMANRACEKELVER
jgi:hypothetical protein